MSDLLPCPEFPFFGARYPDATCIDGYLWDLDKCDDGKLYGGGDDPCPFCNTTEFIKQHHDPYPLSGNSVRELKVWIAKLREKYDYKQAPTREHKEGGGDDL